MSQFNVLIINTHTHTKHVCIANFPLFLLKIMYEVYICACYIAIRTHKRPVFLLPAPRFK